MYTEYIYIYINIFITTVDDSTDKLGIQNTVQPWIYIYIYVYMYIHISIYIYI
jgi:hypothetical protein